MQEVLVIAGEKSGEEHFLSFCDDIININPGIRFFGVGGQEMKRQGVECLYETSEFSSMGFSEPIRRLPFYFKAMKHLVNEVGRRKVKYAILIDFQEFNLKIAEKLTKAGVKVLYYVAPQAWIWREGRCNKLSKYTHRLFSILPFEKKWFEDRGVKNIISSQHPVFKRVNELNLDFDDVCSRRKENPTLLFLPGSRNSEVKKLLPIYHSLMRELKKRKLGLKFSVVMSDSVSLNINKRILHEFDSVYSNKYLDQALLNASFCVAASGTVNLECAFYRVPTIVCYQTSRLNYFIAREIIKFTGNVSLVNIIIGKEVFPELLQDEFNESNILIKILGLINDKEKLNSINQDLAALYRKFMDGESHPGRVMGGLIAKNN